MVCELPMVQSGLSYRVKEFRVDMISNTQDMCINIYLVHVGKDGLLELVEATLFL